MGTGLRAMLHALGFETRNERLSRLCHERCARRHTVARAGDGW